MKKIYLIFIFVTVIIYGCTKTNYETDFKKFLGDKEIIYTGAVKNAIIQPGNLEIGLKWKASTDPTITKYVVFYNNKADSQVVNVTTKSDTIRTVIKNLNEYMYSFTIYSYDAKGNKSVPFDVNNARAYGPIYTGTLLNRGYNADTPYVYDKAKNSVRLKFVAPDTINVKTIINYINLSGTAAQAILLPDSNTITLKNFKLGTVIQYKSYYIPERTALDTFAVLKYSDFPTIVYTAVPVQCDKSLFKELHLPNDVGVYDPSSTTLSKLWDGSVGPQDYPNLFHSDGDHPLPHVLTFDMGKIYTNLAQIEETGRTCCNNPDDFEVWGISDITNAATTLPGNDPGWPAEAKAKGWTLLGEITRSDDGQKAFKANLNDNPPAVRYIRIRVKHVTSGDKNYSNMSELTFWNKQ